MEFFLPFLILFLLSHKKVCHLEEGKKKKNEREREEKAACLGGEVGTGFIGGDSPKSSCQFLEGHLAVFAWDDLLV